MKREVGLAFGSNIGDKVAHIRAALRGLKETEGFDLVAVSSAYRTPPWGFEDQDIFVNACAIAETTLSADDLLILAKDLERKIGRTSTFRWGPRVIDIDLIYVEGITRNDDHLILPHKEALNRAFVLLPLAEIRPELAISGTAIQDALRPLDQIGIEPIDVPLYPEVTAPGAETTVSDAS